MLIGITGHAAVGKDTIGMMLQDMHGFERRAFADLIRDTLTIINPTLDAGWRLHDELHAAHDGDWDAAKAGAYKTDLRRLMQNTGDALRHIAGQDFLIYKTLHDLPPNTVVTDVRFDLEAKAIRERGGVIWMVRRPGVGPVNAHHSDSGISPSLVDLHIDNDGDLEKLAHYITTAYAVTIQVVPQ